MDFDDLDDAFEAPSLKLSRFAPKGAKLKTEPPPPPVVVKKEEVSHSAPQSEVKKLDVDVEFKEEEKEIPESSNFMDEDIEEEEDHVVAEYDVYYTPRDPATQLYVLQYPLRPSWRPYELEQRCTEVRMKPKSGEVEVDLSIDTNSDNYRNKSDDVDGKMVKQTLSSSCRLPQATGYAVGVLSDKKPVYPAGLNTDHTHHSVSKVIKVALIFPYGFQHGELYLNPIHAVVQLRPSMECLNKKHNSNISVKEEGTKNNAVTGASRKQNKQMDPEAVESWISLNYHSSTTELAERYLRKMVTEQKDPIQFSMNPYDYLNSLCPGAVINKTMSRGPSRRSLLSLPLEERLKTLLVEGPSVQRFNAIKHLAPDYPVDDVLEILQKHACLVQGLWVPKTTLRFPNTKGAEGPKIGQGVECLARDYALLLFSHSPIIKDSELNVLGSQKSTGKIVLKEIAVERPYCKDWKFKESTDVSFMKLYPDVVEKQMKLWQAVEQRLQEILTKRKVGKPSKGPSMPGSSMDEGAVRASNVTRPATTSMSKETREALPKILKKLFQSHKVCSFQTICQGLRDMAVSMSSLPKADARAAVAAAKGVDAPQEELQAAICEVAINVHGVYVWGSSLEHPEFEKLRKVVVDLFLGSGPNAKLKKGEFMEAAKIRLQKEPSNSEFQKVITEICVSKGGAWVLKSGDGVPK